MEIETKKGPFAFIRFTAASLDGPLVTGLFLMIVLVQAGCIPKGLLGPDPRAPEQLKLKHETLAANQELSNFLSSSLHEILSDPSNISTLRGTNASATLVSIPAPDEQGVSGRARIGQVNGSTRMNAGGMIAIPLAAYYYAHASNPGYRSDALIDRRVIAMLGNGTPGTVNPAIDSVTQTESGPPLEGKDFEEFAAKRDVVNNWLAAMGLRPPLKVNQKIWETQPFGRDIQLLGNNYNNSNLATSEAIARLLYIEAAGFLDKGSNEPAMLAAMKQATASGSGPTSLASKAWPGASAVYAYATDYGNMYGEAAIVTWSNGHKIILVFMSDRAQAGREISRTLIAKMAEEYPGGIQ